MAVSEVAQAITEITKALSKWIGSSDHRRMAKAIRIGDKIALRIGELNVDDKQLHKLLRYWDKYNN